MTEETITLDFIARQNKQLMTQVASLREYVELQFTMIRNRDNQLSSIQAELQALEQVISRHGKRIEELEAAKQNG